MGGVRTMDMVCWFSIVMALASSSNLEPVKAGEIGRWAPEMWPKCHDSLQSEAPVGR